MRTVASTAPTEMQTALIVKCTGGADHDETRELLRAAPMTAPGGEPWLVAFQIPRRAAGEQGPAPEPKRAGAGHLYYDLPCPSCPRRFRRRVAKLASQLAVYRAHRPGDTWTIDIADPRYPATL
jgi:hypothetical protein